MADIQKVWDDVEPKHPLFDPRMHSALSLLYAPAISVANSLCDKLETIIWVAYLSGETEAHLRYLSCLNFCVGQGWL